MTPAATHTITDTKLSPKNCTVFVSCVPARATSAVIVCTHVDTDQHDDRRDRAPAVTASDEEPDARTAPTINAAHGQPLGPGIQSRRAVHDDRSAPSSRNTTVHCGSIVCDDARDCPAPRAAATCPSSGCGGRARSRCAIPRRDANAAESTAPVPIAIAGPASFPRRVRLMYVAERTQVLVETARTDAEVRLTVVAEHDDVARVRFVSSSLLPSSTTRTVTPGDARARSIRGG